MVVLDYLFDKMLRLGQLFERCNEWRTANLHAEYCLNFLNDIEYKKGYQRILAPLVEQYGTDNIDVIYSIKSLMFHEEILTKTTYWIDKKFFGILDNLEIDDRLLDDAQVFLSGTLKIYAIKVQQNEKYDLVTACLKDQELRIIKAYPNYLSCFNLVKSRQLVYSRADGFVSI